MSQLKEADKNLSDPILPGQGKSPTMIPLFQVCLRRTPAGTTVDGVMISQQAGKAWLGFVPMNQNSKPGNRWFEAQVCRDSRPRTIPFPTFWGLSYVRCPMYAYINLLYMEARPTGQQSTDISCSLFYPLVIQHSRGSHGPFIDDKHHDLPINNDEFPVCKLLITTRG